MTEEKLLEAIAQSKYILGIAKKTGYGESISFKRQSG